MVLGSLNAMIDFMVNLNLRGLLDTGEYEVIYVELVESVAMEKHKYFKSRSARSLFYNDSFSTNKKKNLPTA